MLVLVAVPVAVADAEKELRVPVALNAFDYDVVEWHLFAIEYVAADVFEAIVQPLCAAAVAAIVVEWNTERDCYK